MPPDTPPEPSFELPPLREVIRRYNLGARQALGQNFLMDVNLVRRMVDAAGGVAGKTVFEVGPGPGALTRTLLAGGAHQVIAVELDERCLAPLAELGAYFPGRLTVHHGDVLKIDETALLPAKARGAVRVFANLPYNISTVLLVKWLSAAEWPPWFGDLTLMFQKEVAERITARPGERQYGRLAVLANWRAETRRLFDVPPAAFVPRPKVTSTIIRITPRPTPLAPALVTALTHVAAAAFGQRRKMLRRSLQTLGPGIDVARLLDTADIDGNLRAERLTIEEFAALARAYTDQSGWSAPDVPDTPDASDFSSERD